MNRNVCNRLMERKYVKWLAALFVLLLAVYLVQHPKFAPEYLKQELRDKVVVICGASSGIGEQVAYKYAAVGAKLILSARSADRLTKVQDQCATLGASSVHSIPQDFSQLAEIENFRSKILEIHSNVDILVLNHAAIPLGPWTSLPNQQSYEYTSRTFNINILSFIELVRVFLPDLEQSSGQIQVTSSVSGWCPFYQAGLYTSTKHAVNGFFYSLQQELLAKQSPVTVSVFSLGLIMTPNMSTMLSSEADVDYIPDIVKGEVGECAEIFVSSSVTRPRNVDYPIFMVKVSRLMAYLFPFYHEMSTLNLGYSYQDIVDVHKRIKKVGEKIGYQVGT